MIRTKGKIAFCFPGQLQERPRLDNRHPLWKDPLFMSCAERASLLTKIDLLNFFSPEGRGEGDLCLNLQVATYLLSMVHFYRLQAAGWVPAILAEHSMGVYAALAASEAITFEDGLFITESIGRLLQKAGDSFRGAMASVIGLPLEEVQKICYDLDGYKVFIANYNGSMHYVLSGEEKGVDEAIFLALSRKAISATRLAFNTALHSSSLLALKEEILDLMREVKVRPPRFSILNHWTVQPLEEEGIKDFLSQEIGRPVYWARCVEKMVQEGVTQFVEVGHEATLTKLIRWINRDVEAFCAGDHL